MPARRIVSNERRVRYIDKNKKLSLAMQNLEESIKESRAKKIPVKNNINVAIKNFRVSEAALQQVHAKQLRAEEVLFNLLRNAEKKIKKPIIPKSTSPEKITGIAVAAAEMGLLGGKKKTAISLATEITRCKSMRERLSEDVQVQMNKITKELLN